jgi:putative membrane protein
MYKLIKQYAMLLAKGMGMGAANVIPGVSGGTIALITGIFERIIHAIKSFDTTAIKLLFKGKIKELIKYVDFYFLIVVLSGMVISIVTLAKLLKYLFVSHPVYIWSFFFGLIIASVYYVGKTVVKWNAGVVFSFVFGTGIAIWISYMNPSTPNDSFIYLMICGVVAVCSMILPGLSGSFVLILMGNYELVMIDAVNEGNIGILAPVVLGGIIGILALSHILSWIFKKYKDQTIALLTGFILGSLSILWPWKTEIYRTDVLGEFILKNNEKIVQGYKLFLPNSFNTEVLMAIVLAILGLLTIALIEVLAKGKEEESKKDTH